jgi:hypothetical protein
MATYRIDGTIVRTENATAEYSEGRFHDGNNWISLATGTQWNHQTLYRSRKGRYYVVNSSQWQGSREFAEWVSNEEAARWLLLNRPKESLPDDLAKAEELVSE